MRYFLNVLILLEFLPAAAVKATPYAEYNFATGDIRIRYISGIGQMTIRSASGSLNPDIHSAPVELVPANSAKPSLAATLQALTISHRGKFTFTSLTIRGAFLPGTPVEDVSYFDTYQTTTIRRGMVVEVPEPTAIATIGVSMCGLMAFRLRTCFEIA